MKKQLIGATVAALLIGLTGCKSVTVNSRPGGTSARSDGQSLEGNPVKVDVNLFKGKKVTLSKSGYASKTVNVTFDSPSTINVSLDREFNVKSNPSGASIFVDGEEVGKTPEEAVAMNDSGSTILEVRKKGWLPAKMTIK